MAVPSPRANESAAARTCSRVSSGDIWAFSLSAAWCRRGDSLRLPVLPVLLWTADPPHPDETELETEGVGRVSSRWASPSNGFVRDSLPPDLSLPTRLIVSPDWKTEATGVSCGSFGSFLSVRQRKARGVK